MSNRYVPGRKKQSIRTSPRSIAARQRARDAVELRKAGASYRQIADRLGYKSSASAYSAVRRALEKTLREPTDELREIELQRLDALLVALWPARMRLKRPEFPTPENPSRTPEEVPDLRVISQIMRIGDRRAQLLGMYTYNVRQETEVRHTIDADIQVFLENVEKDPEAKRAMLEATAAIPEEWWAQLRGNIADKN